MITILEETEDGRLDGEPEAKDAQTLLSKTFEDAESVCAVLVRIDRDDAVWRLESGSEVRAGLTFSSPYDVSDSKEFRNWLTLVQKTLQGAGLNSESLAIPGKISLSKTGKIVFGWAEDENHPNSMLLSIGEIMES